MTAQTDWAPFSSSRSKNHKIEENTSLTLNNFGTTTGQLSKLTPLYIYSNLVESIQLINNSNKGLRNTTTYSATLNITQLGAQPQPDDKEQP
jgi:uncharacterized FAD-dependent dehydrogenase